MIEFLLLGPFEGPVEVPGGKPRALLARLLLDAGRVLPADALIDALWGDSPPGSAPKILQAHVSALRKALGAAAIETRGSGYALRDVTSDLARFEELTEQARLAADPARRAELFVQALEQPRHAVLGGPPPAAENAAVDARIHVADHIRLHLSTCVPVRESLLSKPTMRMGRVRADQILFSK